MLIPLEYQTRRKHRHAEIDDADWPLVRGYSWHWQPPSVRAKQSEGYARASIMVNGATVILLLHRLILDAQKGQVVTFKDRNGLNCKRDNLLIGSQGIATALSGGSTKNKTGFRGVSKRGAGFRATVTHNKVMHQSGTLPTARDAYEWAKARRAELHGEAAWEAARP